MGHEGVGEVSRFSETDLNAAFEVSLPLLLNPPAPFFFLLLSELLSGHGLHVVTQVKQTEPLVGRDKVGRHPQMRMRMRCFTCCFSSSSLRWRSSLWRSRNTLLLSSLLAASADVGVDGAVAAVAPVAAAAAAAVDGADSDGGGAAVDAPAAVPCPAGSNTETRENKHD